MFNRTGRAQCPERLSAPLHDTVCFHAYNRTGLDRGMTFAMRWQRGGHIKPVMAVFEGCAEITRGRRVVISLVSIHQFVSLPPRRSVQIYFYPQSYPSPTPLFPLLFHVHDSIRRFEGLAWFTIFGFSIRFLVFSLVGGFLKFSHGNHPAFFRSLNVIRFEDNQIISRVSLSLSFLFHRFLKNLASLEQDFVRRWKLIESIPSDD